MNNADVLKQLFPVELGPVHAQDCAVEGAIWDEIQARGDDLLKEIFPDTAIESLSDWERLYSITVIDFTNTQARRNAILAKMRATGGQSRAYFIAIAAALGYSITIYEPQPFRAGRGRAGQMISVPEIVYCWRVDGAGTPAVTKFRAGQSKAGQRLGAFPVIPLADLFNALKPAHTCVYFGE